MKVNYGCNKMISDTSLIYMRWMSFSYNNDCLVSKAIEVL